MRIENGRVLGVAVLRIENEVCSNLGIVPNRERDLALNYFLKLDCFHVGSLRMANREWRLCSHGGLRMETIFAWRSENDELRMETIFMWRSENGELRMEIAFASRSENGELRMEIALVSRSENGEL